MWHGFWQGLVSQVFLIFYCILTLNILLWSCPADLRCRGGLGVPRGREGHGSSGGSGVRDGPDHSHRPHLLLPRPSHALTGREFQWLSGPAGGRGGPRHNPWISGFWRWSGYLHGSAGHNTHWSFKCLQWPNGPPSKACTGSAQKISWFED